MDDFESYDDKDNRIFDTWVDGLVNKHQLSRRLLAGPVRRADHHPRRQQSMPFEYNNVNAPFYSETDRTFDTPLDLTVSGANSLTLYFMGYPLGFVDKGGNAFSVTSTGSDIWNNADQFRFVYKTLSGNGSITARVDSLTRSDAWSKAGVMIRESLDAGSKHASIVVTPDSSCSQQYRTTTGGASASRIGPARPSGPPTGSAITRTGNVFKAETSPDGKTWTQVWAPIKRSRWWPTSTSVCA